MKFYITTSAPENSSTNTTTTLCGLRRPTHSLYILNVSNVSRVLVIGFRCWRQYDKLNSKRPMGRGLLNPFVAHRQVLGVISAKLHYADTGYRHVVQHHQRTPPTDELTTILYKLYNGQKFATSQHLFVFFVRFYNKLDSNLTLDNHTNSVSRSHF